MKLNNEETKRIANAVKEAESQTGGEIVVAIIPESSSYAAREMLFASAAGVLAFFVACFFADSINTGLSRLFWNESLAVLPLFLGILAILVSILASFLIQIPAIDRIVIGKRAMSEAVRKRAMRHFTESAVYDTVDNTGVLLFVSLMERRVELIADRGINTSVPPKTWENIVLELVKGVKQDDLTASLEKAIGQIGVVLAEHVPQRPDDVNEKPDTPTELKQGS